MEKVTQFLKKNLLPLTIVLITICLSAANYTPSTWLSGWDTLHPEFNFPLNFKRVISGVWREEQGLGAVAAHSHMADLPRMVVLWILSFVFPTSILRYLYIFLCLILGPLGVYYFIKYLLERPSSPSTPGEPAGTSTSQECIRTPPRCFYPPEVKIAAFLGALFYLLNLGTLQHFYVPFEMFPTQFAALGWLFLFAARFLEGKRKGDLALFSLVTLLATPMAYAAHLWYAYFLCFSLYLLVISFFNKKFKPAIVLLLSTLVINSYWLLPNLYFLANHAQNVPLAKSNQLFSEKAFLANKEFGTVKNTAVLKGFLFNWSEHVGNGTFDYLLNEWREYLRNPWIAGIGYGVFALAAIGILIAIFKKEKHGLALLPVFLISFIFLINMNPPFERIFAILRRNSPILKEGLRFPFTKFSTLLMFTTAVYFAFALKFILELFFTSQESRSLPRHLRGVFGCFLLSAACSASLLIYMLPAFSGNLISPSMRVKIPEEYFEMFSWFNQQEIKGRIAHFPIHNLHGWIYYDWGPPGGETGPPSFQGAGFVWFGIKQPFLDRDFDRWTPYNEEYYREMSYAVYAQSLPLVEKLLEKYQIAWIFLDQNVVVPGKYADPKTLFFEELETMFSRSEKINPAKSFGEKIKVYQVNFDHQSEDFVYPEEKIVPVQSQFLWSNFDPAYWEHGTYYLDPKAGFYYPFATLQGKRDGLPQDVLEIKDGYFILKANQFPQNEPLTLSNYIKMEPYISADVFIKREENLIVRLVYDLPKILGEENKIVQTLLSAPVSRENFILGLNDYWNFRVEGASWGKEIHLGKVYLKTEEENAITIYNPIPYQTVLFDPNALNLLPELCHQPEWGAFGISPRRELGGFEILARGVSSCVNIPLSTVIADKMERQESLLSVNFTIQPEGKNTEICFLEQTSKVCLNRSPNLVRVKKENLGTLALKFLLKGEAFENEESVVYEKISFSLFRPEYKTVIDFSNREFKSPNKIELRGNNLSIQGKLTYDYENFAVAETEQPAKICGDLLPQSFDRRVIDENGKSFVEYSSQGGSVCDFFEYPNLPHNQGYILVIKARNVNGLPLRVCLANYASKRCDLYTALSNSQGFKKEVFIIPPIDENGFGYNVHLNNYSIGRTPSRNQVESIEFFAFPYHWAKSMKFSPLAEKENKKEQKLLIFNQSFEKGWKLVGIKNAEHVLVNNWANGWLVDSEEAKKAKIIYLPQRLEYFGFLLLFIFAVSLLFHPPKRFFTP